MKKPVILALAAVYVLSIVIVGIMGGAFRIYNPVVYVQQIECENAEKVDWKTEEERDSLGDYYIFKTKEGAEPLVFEVKCNVLPLDATDKKIEFACEATDEYSMTFDANTGTATLIVNEPTTIYLYAKSSDNTKVEIIIRIDIF